LSNSQVCPPSVTITGYRLTNHRCKMPNVDPDTGFRHPVEPDKSLRLHREVDEGAKHMGCLGMQLTPQFENPDEAADLESWIEVGMDVEVSKRGDHLYIKQ
jgi:uncharacterized protein YcbX